MFHVRWKLVDYSKVTENRSTMGDDDLFKKKKVIFQDFSQWALKSKLLTAQTGGAVRISLHGTLLGRFFDVVVPIAVSISYFSSGEILGWTAGES